MATPSGTISLGDVNTELGLSATALITMNDAAVRTLAGVGGSGTPISMQDLQGKSNDFQYTISSNTSNLNLRSGALAAGWNGTIRVTATINSGVFISSGSTGSYALTIDGSWPGGVQLNNNGTIVGRGGNGGRGGSGSPGCNCFDFALNNQLPGTSAGPGLLVSTAVSIDNGSGRIAGGGGGGGGGSPSGFAAGGGGGGGGIGTGTGGTAGTCASAQAGGAGTPSAAGSGGNGGFNPSPAGCGFSEQGGSGGNGGSYGSAGGSGGASGGSAGACLVGNSNITWIAFGTRNGSIS